ncbi:putative serine/threonine-protein kinase [Sesamum alatum]|uniref:Serine/threonine-protein kinase n=1 Tax=Sesamum alatum TaxID=300844 RepID=A0AAE2CPA0_9LAMI|nr:putative serine/threonine-protein kinase [Sesamum alatum]
MMSPPQGLEKMKLDNGYVKGGYVGPRRSTTGRDMKPELRNGNGNGNRGRASYGAERNVEERNAVGVEGKRKSVSKNGGENKGKVSERIELRNKADEDDELVDGWPKWLTDNIPRDVLRNIVAKSADSYVKIDKVGQGTYSNVYKARDKDTGKIVALKKVRFDTSEPESVKFMAREIMILQKLDHPNIVKLEGLATSRMQYSLYLVFDYFHSDLARILSRPDERLTEPQIKCYMQQLLSGLKHCHDRGILHRDIKGSNLLIDKTGMLKIADFGLANFYNTEKRRPLTSRVVTLWYRAPELLLGSTDYGIGIDLWSAGCLMAEMLAGRPIMPGRTEVEQLHRIFKLCGTPSDDFYRRLKLSIALKPPQTYKSSLREAFRYFPSSSLGLLSILLALDPAHRGSASSALQNEFFQTSPLACDLSGLPVIHIEDDDEALIIDKRKHRTSKGRRRSQTQKDRRKKNLAAEKPNENAEVSKEDQQKSAETSVFSSIPGSSTTSTSSVSVKPLQKEESPPRLFPSPVGPVHGMSPRTEAHPNANKNIKNRPPLPTAKRHTTNYNIDPEGTIRYDVVQRSASSREYRSLEKQNLLQLHALED